MKIFAILILCMSLTAPPILAGNNLQQNSAAQASEQSDQAQENQQDTYQSLDAIFEQIELKKKQVSDLRDAKQQFTVLEAEPLQLRIVQYQLEIMNLYDQATDLAQALNTDNSRSNDYIERMKKEMLPIGPYIRQAIIDKSAQSLPDDIDPMSRKGIRFFEDKNSFINDALTALSTHVDNLNQLSFDSEESTAYLEQELKHRAESLSGEIQILNSSLEERRQSIVSSGNDSKQDEKLYLLNTKMNELQKSLRLIVSLMDSNHINSEEYKTLLIQSSKKVTREILDPNVFFNVIGGWFDELKANLTDNGLDKAFDFMVFLLIIFLFYLLSKLTSALVARSLQSSRLKMSTLMRDMINSLVFRVMMIIGLLVGLSQFGVSVGPILAGLGIAGFVVAFALQDVLSNFAAGAMIIFYRPYDINDMIEVSGGFGKVKSMNMVSTTLLTIDNQSLIIPNNKIWGDVIKNVTSQAVRRVDMVFGVSYNDDIEKVESVLKDILDNTEDVLKKPEPLIKLNTLNNSSVDFIVRPWVKTDNYWDVYWHVTRTVKQRFDAEGISIPYPQQDVHVHYQNEIAGRNPP